MAAGAYTVPDFIDPGLYHRMRLPPEAVSVAGQVKQTLLDAASQLNQGHHMCSLAAKEPFKTSLDLCASLCSSSDEAMLRECSILVRPAKAAGDAIDNDALASRLMRITIKHDNGQTADQEEEAIKRFYVRLRHQYGIRDVSRAWRTLWKTSRQFYDMGNNAKYPIRDLEDNPLRIKWIAPQDANGEGYSMDALRHFIDHTLPQGQRAALYGGLNCVPFTRDHMKHEREETMLGQNTVLALRGFDIGECLGVYGGTFIPSEDSTKTSSIVDFSYMLATSQKDFKKQTSMDGDNIISKINTIFEYDILSSSPNAQSRGGGNVRFVPFQMELNDGSRAQLGAAFVTEPIVPGDELRMNYNYNVQSVKKTFG